jgi:hypothetical protein
MANRNFANSRLYTGHVMPVQIDCKFIVAASDSGGLGITGLKGPYVQAVYMHTSATPAAGSPNPASGTIVVQLQDSFSRFYTGGYELTAPNSGSDVKIDNSAMTAGVAYVITTLGNATAAKWHAIGVPAGITPAVGVAFIASSNGGAGNTLTSRVQTTAAAGSAIMDIELVGSTSLGIAPNPSANQGFGGQIILQCRNSSGTIANPADGTTVHLSFLLSNSSVLIQGE